MHSTGPVHGHEPPPFSTPHEIWRDLHHAATRLWARSRVPRPEFADGYGLTCLGVHSVAEHAQLADFFANMQQAPPTKPEILLCIRWLFQGFGKLPPFTPEKTRSETFIQANDALIACQCGAFGRIWQRRQRRARIRRQR